MKQKTEELIRRYVFLFVGLFINALGVSLITKANLGTSPITSLPYVLSLGFHLSLGTFTFIFNLLLILIQIVLLKRDFKPANFLQIPVVFVFSAFIDLTMYMLSFVNPMSYFMKIVSLLIGCIILGFGVFTEMVANVVMLPGEATVRAITKVSGTDFGKTKIVFDSSMTATAIILSFIMFGALNGIREGTVIAAVSVGFTAKMFKKFLGGIENILTPNEKQKKISMPKPSVN